MEKYLARKYTGVKRFGLEGGESFIPAVHEMVQRAGTHGSKEVVIGMAHRGRLNLLVNILGKNQAICLMNLMVKCSLLMVQGM